MTENLKPITKEEKLEFTIKLQMRKLTDDILSSYFYDEKYKGLIEIWPEYKAVDNELEVEVKHTRLEFPNQKRKSKYSLRYFIDPEKGVKLVV